MFRLDSQVNHSCARGHIDEPPIEQNPLANLVSEQDARIALGDIKEQVSSVADFITAFVGDDFEVVKAVNPAVELRTVDPEHCVALDLFLGGIAGEERNAILAFSRNRVAERQSTLCISLGLPAFHLGFLRY